MYVIQTSRGGNDSGKYTELIQKTVGTYGKISIFKVLFLKRRENMVEVNPNKSVFTINANGLHTTVKIQKDLTLGAKNPIMAKPSFTITA